MQKNQLFISKSKNSNKNNFNKRYQTTNNNNQMNLKKSQKISNNVIKLSPLSLELSPNDLELQKPLSNSIILTKNDKIDENSGEINEDYSLLLNEKLGGGSFGTVYKCINKKTKKEFAAKVESNSNNSLQLNNEYKILKKLENVEGIPKVYLLNQKSNFESIMVYDLLGPNLEDILQFTKIKKFTLKTCYMIFIQILDRLKNIHNLGYIHRDLKPENFLISLHVRDNIIFLIDFGLSKKYIDSNTKSHIAFKKDKPITGTIRYISINTHLTYEQSRRDDIESLLYIILYFFKGELPWDGVKTKTKDEKYEKIKELKMKFKENEDYKNLPYEMKLLFENVYCLEFTEQPNYNVLYNLANKGINNLKNEEINFDNLLDWQKIEFMTEPVFMIQDIKKKKKEEKEKKEIIVDEENLKKENEIINDINNEINNEINNNNISRKTKTLDKKNSNKLMLNNEKKIRKMSNFFSPIKSRKKSITEK